MRVRIGFFPSLLTAAFVHALFACVFVFAFPYPKVSARPVFIFLGSFLRLQDVALSTVESLSQPGKINSHDLNLDMRRDSLSRAFDKPNLINKVIQSARQQYKPVMKKDTGVFKEQKNSDDFDFMPFAPVRMKMERND